MRLFGSIALVMIVLGLPASASAEVWSFQTTLPPPSQPRSLEPEPPVAQQELWLRTLKVVYDDHTGTVTLTWGYYEPTWWAQRLAVDGNCAVPTVPGEYRETCVEDDPVPFALMRAAPRYLGGHMWAPCASPAEVDSNDLGLTPGPGALLGQANVSEGRVQLSKYHGSISAETTFDGTNYTIIFGSSAFAHRSWRCFAREYETGVFSVDPLRPKHHKPKTRRRRA